MWNEVIQTLRFILTQQPTLSWESVPYYFIHFCILSVVFTVGRMLLHLGMNKQLALASKSYASSIPKDRKILILGDSTAVGTGASRPEDTLAGRLAHDFPNAQIVNLGKNGGLIRDLKKQVGEVHGQTFDMVVISAGGNDVWHLSSIKKIERDLEEVLHDAILMSNHRVILLMYSVISSAPLFPLVIRYFLVQRGRKVEALMHRVAQKMQVPTIELFTTESDNPFLENPRELFSSDGIHPSSRGYQVWYNRMWREMSKNGFHLSS